jgi:hypothetical protein
LADFPEDGTIADAGKVEPNFGATGFVRKLAQRPERRQITQNGSDSQVFSGRVRRIESTGLDPVV